MGGVTAGPNSTAVVLWLMILLVFVPIATGHVVARYVEGSEDGGTSVVAAARH